MSHSDKRSLRVFISYKWEDEAHNEWIRKFSTDLREAGIEAILDRWEVRLGESFVEFMRSRIRDADVVLFIISTKSVAEVESTKGKGGAVKFEYEFARAQSISGKCRLIGVYREGGKTPADLSHYRYADFRDDTRYEQNLRDLIADLKDEIAIPLVAIEHPEMVLIPAGEFQMGSNDGYDDEKPVHTVYLDEFYMDIYEVTNAQYRNFIDANPQWGKNQIERKYHDGDYLKGWQGNDYPRGKGNHPIAWVSWYAAKAYAEWSGKRLPTEAKWEKAARGGLVGMKYPRGDEITTADANYGTGDTTPVGSYPSNDYGLYDMAGNVWEWCADWYDDSETVRVLRGGSWSDPPGYLRVANRFHRNPARSSYVVGFRCVSQD